MVWKSTLLALLFCCLGNLHGLAQCGSSFEYTSSFSEEPGGELEINIRTPEAFECTLLRFKNGKYESVESVKGYGNEVVRFSSLDRNSVYSIKVAFLAEEKLCRFRKEGGIKF